jgi:hypothetical protein
LAATLGILMQSSRPSFHLDSHGIDSCAHLAVLHRVLRHYLDQSAWKKSDHGHSHDFVRSSSRELVADMESVAKREFAVRFPLSSIEYVFLETDGSMSELPKLEEQLPVLIQCLSLRDSIASTTASYRKPHDLPDPCRRMWLRSACGLLVLSSASIYTWIRRDRLSRSLVEAMRTGMNFISNWIWEPCVRIWKTIRHEDTLRLTAGSLSLSSDLDVSYREHILLALPLKSLVLGENGGGFREGSD